MPYEKFIHKRFTVAHLDVIEKANEIIAEYAAQGFALTLRQLYYQFVARGLRENTERSYKNLGNIISNGRLAGLIDWEAIEDRGRQMRYNPAWYDPKEFVGWAAERYHEDRWETQDRRVEVWIEKAALEGVIEPVCRELDIPFFACRGYNSQSEAWRAGKRFYEDASRFRRRTLVLHLGDHDPSGIDMTRDNRERLRMFSSSIVGHVVDVKRIALNYDQVEEHNPPPNPTKLSDSRAGSYVDNYGYESWELDALDPATIDALIREEVGKVIDWDRFNEVAEREEERRELMFKASDNWDAVAEFLEDMIEGEDG